ncbi:MAG: NYN domain-containing protein [Nanoarchaeota archaeon]
MEKIAIYIDGSNFYFSVKKKFGFNIDIKKFCDKLAEKDKLVKINYYIAPIDKTRNAEMYANQQKFFEKLKKIDKLAIVLGRLERRKQDGKEYYVEKATDVNLTLDLVLDAQANVYDEAYLISNDGDFSGAIKAVIERFGKEIVYVAIGNRKSISYHLKQVASRTLKIESSFVTDLKI